MDHCLARLDELADGGYLRRWASILDKQAGLDEERMATAAENARKGDLNVVKGLRIGATGAMAAT